MTKSKKQKIEKWLLKRFNDYEKWVWLEMSNQQKDILIRKYSKDARVDS